MVSNGMCVRTKGHVRSFVVCMYLLVFFESIPAHHLIVKGELYHLAVSCMLIAEHCYQSCAPVVSMIIVKIVIIRIRIRTKNNNNNNKK